MKRNVGTTDRIIRAIIGLAIIAVGNAYRSWWGLIGLLPLATAAIGFCGLYRPFGISTCKVKQTTSPTQS